MKKGKETLIGAHMSIAKGLHFAIERGESIGCTCIQIFTKNNRRLFAPALKNEEINKFKEALKKSTIVKSVVAHSGYLINVASPDKEKRGLSINSLTIELERCEQLEIPYLVLHPGACLGASPHECLKTISESIDEAISRTNQKTKILLETVAGEGTKIGSKFEQLAEIKELARYKKNIGVCFDTCHAFAAGYSFTTEKEYEKMWDLFDNIVGIKDLQAFHINDSKGACGSRVDRHESIGMGKIGLNAFRFLMNDSRFKKFPKILETPKTKDLSEDLKNILTLKNLISK